MGTKTKISEHVGFEAFRVDKVVLACRNFSQHESGSSTIEYAFFLAMIVGGILMAVQLLNDSTNATFDSVAVAVQTTESPGSKSLGEKNQSATAEPSQPELSVTTEWRAYLPIAQAASFIVIIGLWLLIRRDMRLARIIVEKASTGDGLSEDRQQRIFIKRQEILNVLTSEMEALMESRIEVGHLMSRKTRTVTPRASVEEVIDILKRHHIRHVLVCDKNKKLLGIISDRDLQKRDARVAQDLMTPDPLSVAPSSLVSPAVTLMMKECISALPVVEEDQVIGMLTSTDLMMALQCSMQILQKVALIVSPAQARNLEDGVLAC